MCRIFVFLKLCSLVKHENTKRPGFYTLLVTRVFSNFPQLKWHTGKVGPETKELGPLGGTRDPLSGTQDPNLIKWYPGPRTQNFQEGPRTPEVEH